MLEVNYDPSQIITGGFEFWTCYMLIHPEQKAIIFIELPKVFVHFYVKRCFHHLSFFHYFCSWIGEEHAKESLIIYKNYALLYVGFMKYFYWYVSYLEQFLWYLKNCLLSIWTCNCWKRICSATNIIMEFYFLKDDFRNRE